MTFMVNVTILFSAQAVLILAIQILELYVVLQLLKFPGKPQYDILDFFHANKSLKPRSWVLASVIGFGFLVALVAITSYVADKSLDPKVTCMTLHLFVVEEWHLFFVMNNALEIN